jgi:hypothetical protein
MYTINHDYLIYLSYWYCISYFSFLGEHNIWYWLIWFEMEVNNIHTDSSVLHRQHGPHYLVQQVSVWHVSRWCCPEPHQRQIPVMIKDMKSNSYDNNLKKTLLLLDLPRLLFVHIWLIIECFWKFPFLNFKIYWFENSFIRNFRRTVATAVVAMLNCCDYCGHHVSLSVKITSLTLPS